MRALVTIAVIGLLAAAVSAQTCTVQTTPSVDPFAPSTCSAYVACDTAFCACSGATANQNNATACLASVPLSVNCSQVQTCLLAYTTCLQKTEANRTSPIAACNATGTNFHNAILAAAATTYAGSVLQRTCQFRVCEVMGPYRTNCSFGTNDTNVCKAPTTAVPTTTSAVVTTAFAIRATLKLSGTAYAALLNNPTARANLEAALATDLGTLLGISPSFIRILNLSLGSLIVDFAILNGSGKSVSQLSSGLALATNNSNWLTTTKAVYKTVSNETIGVLSLDVTQIDGSATTASPVTTTTPTTTASVTGSAAGTSVVAAAAVAVLALLL